MSTVQLSTYLSPYKPIPSAVAGWDDARQATWPATSSSLITVEGHAVLVDALMTVAEGRALGDWVSAAGAALDTVYVTHAHADHFFGATSLLKGLRDSSADSLPARLVTRPEIVHAAAIQIAPGYLRVWNGFFPGQIADAPLVPQVLAGDLSPGHPDLIRAISVGQSDVEVSSVVHVADLRVVLSGDVVYNGVHLWLAGSTPQTRSAWLDALDAVERLAPLTIIAGHRDPAAADDNASRQIEQTRSYIRDFDDAAAKAGGPAELVTAMLAGYGAFGNEYTLWVAAASQFQG